MDSSPEATPELRHNTCPYCRKQYKRVRNHLPYCKERGDRDYSAYLAKNTLAKRKRASTRKACPKCHRLFTRLDTHLSRNAVCKLILYSDAPSSSAPTLTSERKLQQLLPTMQLTPINGLEIPPSHSTPQDHSAQATHLSSAPMGALNFPSSQQEWEEADNYLRKRLVPPVLFASSPEVKNRVLSEGIYDYFAQKFGTRQQKPTKQHRRRVRQAAEGEELKNLARRDFKNAKKQGLSADSIQPLAKKFKEHSRLKKALSAVKYCDQTRRARHACNCHFWQFARQLLDDNSTNSITHRKRHTNSFKKCTMPGLRTMTNWHGCQHQKTNKQTSVRI